jgi:hypothetical protein
MTVSVNVTLTTKRHGTYQKKSNPASGRVSHKERGKNMTKKKCKFPETIYVTRENPNTQDEFLSVETDRGNVGQFGVSVSVAVYELKEVRIAVNKTELV